MTEPGARNLHGDRNHIEHKYFKVHNDFFGLMPNLNPMFNDTLAHSMTKDELEGKTLRLLKLARAALIYLACGMSARERKLKATEDPMGFIIPMNLPKMPDREKW